MDSIYNIDTNVDFITLKKIFEEYNEELDIQNIDNYISYFNDEIMNPTIKYSDKDFISKISNKINNYKNEGNFLDIIFNLENSAPQKKFNQMIIKFNDIITKSDKIIQDYQDKLNKDTKYSKNNLINNSRITFNSQNKLLYFIRYKYNIIFSILLIIIFLGTYIMLSKNNNKPIN